MRVLWRRALLAIVVGQVLWRAVALAFPKPFPRELSFLLESPFRLALGGPHQLLKRLALQGGETVLELGAGTGVFTVEVARAVGVQGTVYALDISPAMLGRLLMRAERAQVANILPLLADARSIPLPDGSVDIALMVTVLGEVSDRRGALKEIHRVLKSGGLLSITEMMADPHYLPGFYVTALARQCGFETYSIEGMPWFRTYTFRKISFD